MFLQQIQCMDYRKIKNISQEESRSDKQKSETIESMVAAVDDSIVKIDKIICYIDELYKKGQNEQNSTEKTQQQSEEQKVGVENSKIDADQALKCARQKLQNLNSTDQLVELLDSFSQNNKLKHIIRENIDMETTSGIVLSDTAETREKTLELDTKTLTDLLVLQWILKEHQTERQVTASVNATLTAAREILRNMKQRPREITQLKQNGELTSSLVDVPIYDKLPQLYCNLTNSKSALGRELSQIEYHLKAVFETELEAKQRQKMRLQKLQKKLKELFTEVKKYQLETHTEITKFQIAVTSNNHADSDNNNENANQSEDQAENFNLLVRAYTNRFSPPAPQQDVHRLQMQTSAGDEFDSSSSPAHQRQYEKHSRNPTIINNQLPCLLDPAIEGKITQCLKYVIDPTLYSRYHPQEREIDTSTQSDDDNSRLLTIGGIAILGVVTIGAGWYLFSNDDSNTIDNRKIRSNDNNNNTSNNRTIQLSQKTNTSMQLAKPTNVSATKRTDVSAQPNALAQTHQEQIAANQPN
jgi:hypothetical protein